MKRILIALSCVLAMATASAENWSLVKESNQGARMLVDIDSFTLDAKADDGTPLIAAKFRYVYNGNILDPFVFVTYQASCTNNNGAMYSRSFKNNEWVTTETYWWSASSERMYDHAGKFMCDVYRGVAASRVNKKKQIGKST